jgi:hypothetical protein
MDIEPIHPTRSGEVAEPFEGWTHQGGATVALVQERVGGREGEAVSGHLRLQGRDLAGDGMGGSLLLGGDPCVDGRL